MCVRVCACPNAWYITEDVRFGYTVQHRFPLLPKKWFPLLPAPNPIWIFVGLESVFVTSCQVIVAQDSVDMLTLLVWSSVSSRIPEGPQRLI